MSTTNAEFDLFISYATPMAPRGGAPLWSSKSKPPTPVSPDRRRFGRFPSF
jgi:hypothetical protein